MTTITDQQYKSLVQGIYETLISNPEFGMGEMGDCMDEGERIVNEWMKKEDIHLEGDETERTYISLRFVKATSVEQAIDKVIENDFDEDNEVSDRVVTLQEAIKLISNFK